MEIINCQTATNRIMQALAEMDLDDLAKATSLITMTSPVIIVDDGIEIDENDVETTLATIAEDGTIGASDLCDNGVAIGYVDEDGKIQEFGCRYEAQNPMCEADHGTLIAHIENRDLVPIYDETTKQIICYAIQGEEDRIIKALDR